MTATDHNGDERTLFDVKDALTVEETKKLGFSCRDFKASQVKAVAAGPFRAPKKGEWYLSGAIPEAYRAPNDFAPENQYHILHLVRVEVEVITRAKIVARLKK